MISRSFVMLPYLPPPALPGDVVVPFHFYYTTSDASCQYIDLTSFPRHVDIACGAPGWAPVPPTRESMSIHRSANQYQSPRKFTSRPPSVTWMRSAPQALACLNSSSQSWNVTV